MAKRITPENLFLAVSKILTRAGIPNVEDITHDTTLERITPSNLRDSIDALLIRYANEVVKSSEFGWRFDASKAPELDLTKNIEWLATVWLSPCVRKEDLW